MRSSAANLPAAEEFAKAAPLPPSFYLRDTVQVAQDLIGKGLFLSYKRRSVLVEIAEVEAYLDTDDPASHAFKGVTKRNRSMFAEGGHCYVYLSYGINYCMNVVTREAGIGQAVLIRAAIPLVGVQTMRDNRGQAGDKETNLLSGPGKLTQALGIDLTYDGRTFFEDRFKIVDLDRPYGKHLIGSSPRIGISRAKSNPWRFFLKECPHISRR